MRLSKSGYAKSRGRSPSYISKLLARGVIVAEEDGSIDVERADASIAAHRHIDRPSKDSGRKPDPKSATSRYMAARARREEHLADLAQLLVAEREGALASVSEVQSCQFAIASRVRNGFERILDHIDRRLSRLGGAEASRLRGELRAEVRVMMNEMSESLRKDAE
jgi:phage terminase Nu1 subunit (DNA packaging protein)